MNIELKEGEIYIGRINDEHIILLPGDNDDATHEAQLEWAKSIGGDLPTRIEQSMLWANHREQFQKDWYWSNEIHRTESGNAWYQGFCYGCQNRISRDYKLRARAVRRIKVKGGVMNTLNRLFSLFRIYRWWKGGLWVLHTDQTHWREARWLEGGFIYDERCHAYHRTLLGIVAIEDYTK